VQTGMRTDLVSLKALLDSRFGGVLKAGSHEQDGEACALELLSVARGVEWTDSPVSVRSFDLRRLNDIAVSDEVRTECLLPVIAAYDGSLDWPERRQRAVVDRLVVLLVQRIVAELPRLDDRVREQCRGVKTRAQTRDAAAYADADAAAAAAYAAAAAADAAAAAAYAAAAAARERVFRTACQVWLDAVAATG